MAAIDAGLVGVTLDDLDKKVTFGDNIQDSNGLIWFSTRYIPIRLRA